MEKPLRQWTRDDLDELCRTKTPESLYLEFKKTIPLSKEEEIRQRKAGITNPIDPKLAQGSFADHGRNELLEEVVAFANAQGGKLLVGVDETKDAPPRAATIEPLQELAKLERKLIDSIVDCVEPPLPSFQVRGIPVQGETAGVLCVEVAPSPVAPHRVKTTRHATIRRNDRCDRMTMPEIHRMVAMKSGQADAIAQTFAQSSHKTRERLFDLIDNLPGTVIGEPLERRVRARLKASKLSALSMRVTAIPLSSLNLQRLDNLDGLVPSGGVCLEENGQLTRVCQSSLFGPSNDGTPIYGGVVHEASHSDLVLSFRAMRDGTVEAVLFTWERTGQLCAFGSWMMDAVGRVLGVYNKLRNRAGMGSMPAEVDVEILSLNGVKPTPVGESRPVTGSKELPESARLGPHSVATMADFESLLNQLAEDLLNAGGRRADGARPLRFDPS
ncbi:helix-turn-helix domain-containing protein [Enterovirga sp. CN4-39]|uniref:AlbA family DNA-binding domain-containing protein n=1 Tax=Enterovirga sp. CN4-39 TaxID=3400910 RepID=UPI003BFBAFD7